MSAYINEIHVVIPMVRPVACTKDGHGMILGLFQNHIDELSVAVLQVAHDVQLFAKLKDLSRTERSTIQDIAQYFGTLGVRCELLGNFDSIVGVRETVNNSLDGQRFVAIGLDERQEHLDIKRTHSREKGNVIATILRNIAIVSGALRKVGRIDLERIVITLQITVDTRKRMEHLD